MQGISERLKLPVDICENDFPENFPKPAVTKPSFVSSTTANEKKTKVDDALAVFYATKNHFNRALKNLHSLRPRFVPLTEKN